jgi:hypothetical protein
MCEKERGNGRTKESMRKERERDVFSVLVLPRTTLSRCRVRGTLMMMTLAAVEAPTAVNSVAASPADNAVYLLLLHSYGKSVFETIAAEIYYVYAHIHARVRIFCLELGN